MLVSHNCWRMLYSCNERKSVLEHILWCSSSDLGCIYNKFSQYLFCCTLEKNVFGVGSLNINMASPTQIALTFNLFCLFVLLMLLLPPRGWVSLCSFIPIFFSLKRVLFRRSGGTLLRTVWFWWDFSEKFFFLKLGLLKFSTKARNVACATLMRIVLAELVLVETLL